MTRVDFTKTGKPVRHGTHSSYTNHGCRCDECREANRVECAQQKARRDPTTPGLPHGSVSTYDNWNCRCGECRAAKAVTNAEQYRKRATR